MRRRQPGRWRSTFGPGDGIGAGRCRRMDILYPEGVESQSPGSRVRERTLGDQQQRNLLPRRGCVMITYSDGTEAKVGDQVDYDGAPSIVEAVIDSPEQRAEWGVRDRGL